MLPTQRSSRFPKPEKWVIFFHFSKRGTPWKIFLEILNFRNGWKWHFLCKMRRFFRWFNGKVTVTISCWVMSFFIFQICPPKRAWKTAFYRSIWNADAGQRRPWRHWKILGMKHLIKYFKEICVARKTMLPTQSSPRFPKPEKSVIFGVLAQGETPWKVFGKLKFLKRLKVTYFM